MATGHRSSSSALPSCPRKVPDGSSLYFPCNPGEERLRVPCPPSPVAPRSLAVGSVYPGLMAAGGGASAGGIYPVPLL